MNGFFVSGLKYSQTCIAKVHKLLTFIFVVSSCYNSNAQVPGRPGFVAPMSFGVHFDPVISWFGTNIDAVSNQGARPGFNFGISYNRYFGPNYSFSTGINIINAGGRLISRETTLFELKNYEYKIATVGPNEAIIYKIQYMAVPLGLKLQTNQIGYMTFFADLGIDPKVVIGGKADIPSLQIKGETATAELRAFNLSYHVMTGVEYSVGGTTAVVLGLGFDNNFFDITKDNGEQPADRVSHKLFSFRMGVNF
jgi:hypothetical protein